MDKPNTSDDGTNGDDQYGDEAAGLAGVGAEPFVVAVDGYAAGGELAEVGSNVWVATGPGCPA